MNLFFIQSEKIPDGMEMKGHPAQCTKMEEDDAMEWKHIPVNAERVKDVHDQIERVCAPKAKESASNQSPKRNREERESH